MQDKPEQCQIRPVLVGFFKGNNKNHVILGLLVLVLLGAALYANILHAPFIFDDYGSIVDNEAIKNLKLSLLDFSNNRYLTNLTFALNYRLGGLKPFGYHLFNNLIHAINAFLVYYLVLLTFRTPQLKEVPVSTPFIAFSSALIFIAHPLQTQAVTYIVQRATSIATLFYLISLIIYIKWRLFGFSAVVVKNAQKATPRIQRSCLYPCLLLSIFAAMKSKEVAFTLPLMIVAYEFSFFQQKAIAQNKNSFAKRYIHLLPIIFTMLIIPVSMITMSSSERSIAENLDKISKETTDLSRNDYLLTQSRVILTYLRLLFFPINQNLDYRYPVYDTILNIKVILSFLILVLLLSVGVYLFFRSKYQATSPSSKKNTNLLRISSFGIFWFFITLSVESTVIPIKDVIVEHRIYLPSIGIFIIFASLLEFISSRPNVKQTTIAIIVVALSVATINRNNLWADPQKLWEDVISKSPNNTRAINELGAIYRDEGRFMEANALFEKALQKNKNYALTYYNLGDIQLKLNNYMNAIAFFETALAYKLTGLLRMEIFNSLGIAYSEMEKNENAIASFRNAIKEMPSSIIPYSNLGMQYLKMGKPDLAIEVLNKALQIRESPSIYYNLSKAYTLLGDSEKSRIMKEKALLLSAN